MFSKWLTDKKAVMLIVITGSIVYFNGLFAVFAWDDYDQLLNNIPVHSITNFFSFFAGGNVYTGTSKLFGIYYKPMMSTVFSLVYSLSGPNPFLFHLVQILIHIINSILVFWLFKKFFYQTASFIASVIFLVHPINTETVIFISALQDVLYMLFGLLALQLVSAKKITNLRLTVIAVLLLLSILSKETGILFFAILPLYKWIYGRRGLWKIIVVVIMDVSIYVILRFAVAGIGLTSHGNATIMQTSLSERAFTMVKIFSYYFLTFVFPKDLSIAQLWIVRSPTFYDFYLPLVLDCVIISLGIASYFWLKKRKADLKAFYFFISWLVIGLLFHLQIFPLDMTVAERWFYFPMIGLLGVFCLVFQNITLRKEYIRTGMSVLIILIITGLSIRTVFRNYDWGNEMRLYQHDAKISKNNVILEENIGTQYYNQNNLDEAQYHFQKAVEIQPKISVVWYNLGVIAGRKKNFDLAKADYQKAIDAGGYSLAYDNLAVISFAYGTPEEAEKTTKKALLNFPNDPKLWLIYALTENKLKKHEEALVAAKNAYILNQNNYTAGVYNAINNNQTVQDPKINFE